MEPCPLCRRQCVVRTYQFICWECLVEWPTGGGARRFARIRPYTDSALRGIGFARDTGGIDTLTLFHLAA